MDEGLVPKQAEPINLPLTDSQKLSVTTIRLKKVNIEKQIADLQTQAARLDAFFYSELSRIASENRIDMQKFVLSDDLELKPKA